MVAEDDQVSILTDSWESVQHDLVATERPRIRFNPHRLLGVGATGDVNAAEE